MKYIQKQELKETKTFTLQKEDSPSKSTPTHRKFLSVNVEQLKSLISRNPELSKCAQKNIEIPEVKFSNSGNLRTKSLDKLPRNCKMNLSQTKQNAHSPKEKPTISITTNSPNNEFNDYKKLYFFK